MCTPILAPIICTFQSIVRVFIIMLLAAEDIIRLLIHIVHSYVSTVLHAISLLPTCVVFCCMKKCYCTPSFRPGHGYRASCCCSCLFVISLTAVIILIIYKVYWSEDIFKEIGLEIPINILNKVELIRKAAKELFVNNTKEYERVIHKYTRLAAMSGQSKSNSTQKVKYSHRIPSETLTGTDKIKVKTNAIAIIKEKNNMFNVTETNVRNNKTKDVSSLSENLTTPTLFITSLNNSSDSFRNSTMSDEPVTEILIYGR